MGYNTIKSDKGFTVIEVIISTAILLVMVLSIYTFFVSGLFSSLKGENKSRAVQIVRFAMDGELTNPRNPGLIDELRRAGKITLADEDSINFDITDTSGVTINTIDYSYLEPVSLATTASIQRADTQGSAVIADHILHPDGLQFTYFDGNGDTLAFPIGDPSVIRQIQVEIKTDINGDGQPDAVLTTKVAPRNL
ncbi:MAG: prepilin-type N-terminal cleavage/methylation domain-containing protein [bacterium]